MRVSMALLLAGCLLAGCSSEPSRLPDAKREVTLMLNWVPYGEHAPYYYGLEKGFFAKEGLDLVIQPGGGSGRTVQAVDSGQVSFGHADTPALIKAIAAGANVRSIGVVLQRGPGAVEFFLDQEIKTPADLKGKTVAATPGDAVFQTFPAFLAANGMSLQDVQLVNVDPAGKMAVLMEGKVDTLIGFFHDQAPTIENATGRKVGVLRYSDYGVNLLGTGLVAGTETLENDPQLVRAFLRAASRSWEEAEKDPQGAIGAMTRLAEKTPPESVLAEQLAKTFSLLHTEATQGMRPIVNAKSDWEATIQLLGQYAKLGSPGSPHDYWDPRFAPVAE